MSINFFTILLINYLSFDEEGQHEFLFTGSGESIYLKRGRYEIDVYGAQGGRGYANGEIGGEGGPGAQVHCEFYITSNESVEYHVFVGEKGVGNSRDPGTIEGPNRGGFNGGGAGGADIYWSDTEGIPNDAPGGGGGATDLRTNFYDTQTRVIVAGGGSGGAFNCQGNPGGTLCGMTSAWHCGVYECSNNTNTDYMNGKKCSYPNGQGATGFDYTSTPPSGGGGGFCGGHDSLSDDEVWPPIADSGSSYAKECLNDYDEELCFFNIEMKSGVKEGDGSLIIKKIWECQDENCLYCKNAANICQTCNHEYFRYNGNCVSSCPESSFLNGTDCIDCNPECKTCQNSKDECTSCIDSYYLYNNSCYADCSVINNEITNLYFGKDLIENKCKNCIDENCINCNENFQICTNCSSLYYLNETTNECIHIPTNQFSESYHFSESKYFSSSSDFTYSNDFSSTEKFTLSIEFSKSNLLSSSNKFTFSNEFSKTSDFTSSNEFKMTKEFTKSIDFSKSKEFTFSDNFSQTEYFSSSSKFTDSFKFSNSKDFSQSNLFSKSFAFTFSNKFSQSDHLKTKKFSQSNIFSSSLKFTQSNQFSLSNYFIIASKITQSNQFLTQYKRRTTTTASVLLSYSLLKSVSFSISHYYSYSFSMININGQISF